jgi:hypothetical protein
VVRETLTADHVDPAHLGGTEDEDNIVPACYPCNNLRNNGVAAFAARLEGKAFGGVKAKTLQRLAVQHDQLVVWLAEAGYVLTAEMKRHLGELGRVANADPDWPVTRRDSTLLDLLQEEPQRFIALHNLLELAGERVELLDALDA